MQQESFKGSPSKPEDSAIPDFMAIPGTICRSVAEVRAAVQAATNIAELLEGSGSTIAWAYHLQHALVRLFTQSLPFDTSDWADPGSGTDYSAEDTRRLLRQMQQLIGAYLNATALVRRFDSHSATQRSVALLAASAFVDTATRCLFREGGSPLADLLEGRAAMVAASISDLQTYQGERLRLDMGTPKASLEQVCV